MAHRARVLRGERTIRFHYANCATFNADFYGDEINLHLPQEQQGRAEGYFVVHADHQFMVCGLVSRLGVQADKVLRRSRQEGAAGVPTQPSASLVVHARSTQSLIPDPQVPTDGKPVRGLIQDHVIAAVMMTKKDTFLDRATFLQLCHIACSCASPLPRAPCARAVRSRLAACHSSSSPSMLTGAPRSRSAPPRR